MYGICSSILFEDAPALGLAHCVVLDPLDDDCLQHKGYRVYVDDLKTTPTTFQGTKRSKRKRIPCEFKQSQLKKKGEDDSMMFMRWRVEVLMLSTFRDNTFIE